MLEADGIVAYATVTYATPLNSHRHPFVDANLKRAENCTAVLVGVMRDDLLKGR